MFISQRSLRDNRRLIQRHLFRAEEGRTPTLDEKLDEICRIRPKAKEGRKEGGREGRKEGRTEGRKE